MNDAPDGNVGSDEACANCGKHTSDAVKLKNCMAVKCCGAEDCQKTHRKQPAELEDEKLYSQGHERPEGDICPICTLPIPLPMAAHSVFVVCCMKTICNGCNIAAQKRGMVDCPFCRTRFPGDDADALAMIQARVEKKDPEAVNDLAEKYYYGMLGLQKDVRKAVDLWTESAELSSLKALCHLGVAHYSGNGVQENKAMGILFFKKAAMRGHVESR